LVNARLGALDDLSASGAQFSGQRIYPRNMKESIISDRSSTCVNLGLIRAIEEHFDVIAAHNCKYWISFRSKGDLFPIPIAGDLKTEHVPIIFARPNEVRNSELRHGTFEADNRILIGFPRTD